jgi:hypothetical protein
MHYLTKNEFAYVTCKYQRSGNSITVTLGTTGSFPGMPQQRRWRVRLVCVLSLLGLIRSFYYTINRLANSWLPTAVKVNGADVPYSRRPQRDSSSWRYDGNEVSTVIDLAPSSSASIQVTTDASPQSDTLLSGLKGGIRHATLAKRNLDAAWVSPGSQDTTHKFLLLAANTGDTLSYLAGTDRASWTATVTGYQTVFAGAVQEVAATTGVNPTRLAYSKALLDNAFN